MNWVTFGGGHLMLAFKLDPGQLLIPLLIGFLMTKRPVCSSSGFKVESISSNNKSKSAVAKEAKKCKAQLPKQNSSDDYDSELPDEFSAGENSDELEEVNKDWLASASEDELQREDDDNEDEDEDEEDDDDDNDDDEFSVSQKQQNHDKNQLIINTADESTPSGIPNLSLINSRIQAAIAILSDWKTHAAQATKSRSEYISQLRADFCVYFGYGEFLMEKFMQIFPKPAELQAFLEANEMQRPVTIRCNTLKCRRKDLAQALISRGVNLEPTMERWNPVGLQVFDSKVPIGATPEYLAGHYMLQAAASFLPVLAMGISSSAAPGERILDMCAAPGGKTTFIAAQMRNTGFLFANDLSADRIKALAANVQRMGVQNCVVTCLDGRKYPQFLKGFDRILLDAPCTGTGVISKDTSVKTAKNAQELATLNHTQKELILAAIDALEGTKEKPGVLVYSTCSVLVEENEEIVEYALRKRSVHLVETGLEFGEEGFTAMQGKKFSKSMNLTRRFYPHTHNLDGFFVAKLVKTAHE